MAYRYSLNIFVFLFSTYYLEKRTSSLSSAEEICINNVQYHRGPDFLPSTGPFCLVKKSQVEKLKEVEIVTTHEGFELLEIVSDKKNNITDVPIIQIKTKNGNSKPFLVPASTFDDSCSGQQELEIGRNFTIRCVPSLTNFTKSSCENNVLLSVDSFVGPVITGNLDEEDEDKDESFTTIETVIRQLLNVEIRRPVWANGTCHNVLKKILIIFKLKNHVITDAIIPEIEYLSLTQDNYIFQQVLSFNYVNDIDKLDENIMNNTEYRGYRYGDQIFISKKQEQTVMLVPSVGDCSETIGEPVLFLQEISTGCNIQVNACDEAQSFSSKFYENFTPEFVLTEHSRSNYSREVPFLRTNLSFPTSKSQDYCRLVSLYSLDIAFARQGLENDYFIIIVGITASITYSDVIVQPNRSIPIPFQVRFKDVTPKPEMKYAALPHINLRLPSDFFYPFMSSITSSYSSFIILILLLICL